jgi:protein-disulfide isomerase
MNGQATADLIARDVNIATRLKLQGTPSLLIGDSLYFGVAESDLVRITQAVAARRGVPLPR